MEIANAIVKIHATHYGRGPTKARAHVTDELALVVLEDIFTPVERTLIEAGKADKVLGMRDGFQAAMKEEFVSAVEVTSGRTVRAFVSQTILEPEMGVELFMFEPPEVPHD
ncbi:MAG TPA: Na-translocating system protein MpsC family protein [Thermoleophilaceae bacterium]